MSHWESGGGGDNGNENKEDSAWYIPYYNIFHQGKFQYIWNLSRTGVVIMQICPNPLISRHDYRIKFSCRKQGGDKQ